MLRQELRLQLDKIEPSRDWHTEFYPCEVTLDDGTVIDRVYVAPTGTWSLEHEESSPRHVSVERVQRIRESPNRLPVALANKLYEAGESGMGYTLFGIKTLHGFIIPCCTGNAVDFVKLPNGVSLSDVEDVIPHWGREIWGKSSFRAEGADFKWCLY